MSQFKNERALFSFTGLTPREFTTGEHRRLGHISRQGSSRLRAVLVEVAWRAIKLDPALNADYQRIVNHAGKKRAIVAIARKLIGRARALFRKREYYAVHRQPAPHLEIQRNAVIIVRREHYGKYGTKEAAKYVQI
jgi:transposase